jgi:hypothetical protein
MINEIRLDVAPEEFEVLEPRVIGGGGRSRPGRQQRAVKMGVAALTAARSAAAA